MPKKPMDDEAKLRALIDEMSADSLSRRESKEEWVARLEALKEAIDIDIQAAGVEVI